MRSTTFDMVGMTLTALAVILICGGVLTAVYVASTRPSRGGERADASHAETDTESGAAAEPRELAGRR